MQQIVKQSICLLAHNARRHTSKHHTAIILKGHIETQGGKLNFMLRKQLEVILRESQLLGEKQLLRSHATLSEHRHIIIVKQALLHATQINNQGTPRTHGYGITSDKRHYG